MANRVNPRNTDTTLIQVEESQDAFEQMTFGGQLGKGHCLLISNITCPTGRLLVVTPGPSISCTPRGGDGTSLGVQLSLAQNQRTGFTRLFRGTPNIGTSPNFDRGYVNEPGNVDRGSNPTMLEFGETYNLCLLFREMKLWVIPG